MFLMFYFSYLFSVVFLGFLVMFLMLVYMSSVFFIKYLVILVYVSGVVVFILYISCMCWFVDSKVSLVFLFLVVFIMSIYDLGYFSKLSELGSDLWMYLFFSFLFNILVMGYSLNLFKISGSLRF